MEEYQNLRKNIKEVHGEVWTIENLKDGLEYFKDLNGRYPSSKEIDSFEYLPSRKTIERKFGGIVELRKTLNHEGAIDFTKGAGRSVVAQKTFLRAQNYERDFFKYLISKIPEVRVHEHKIIRPGDTAADFFIYLTDNTGIVVDLFYAADIHSLMGVVNIKHKKYTNVLSPVYFVLIDNDEISQDIIDKKINNRKNKLSGHIQVMTEESFKKSLNSLIKI